MSFCYITAPNLPRRLADQPNRRLPNTAAPSTTAPAASATQKPLAAPKWSIIQPELAAPMATPMLRPVISQVMPSVRRLGGTIRSTTAMDTIRVGAKNSPEMKIATARPGILVTSNNGKVVNAVATPQHRNWRGNAALSLRVPKAKTARHEPMAYTDSTILAAAGWPCCWAKATLTTSTTPTITPMASNRIIRINTEGEAISQRS